MTENLLEVRDLTVTFGGVVAIDNVKLDVVDQEIHGLVGPNGSGKTTLINCVSGFVRPSKGEIRFAGRNLVGRRPFSRSRLGVARSFQHPGMFSELPVRESVTVGAHNVDPMSWPRTLRPLASRRSFASLKQRVDSMADELGLTLSADAMSTVSFGQQRLADIARAVIGEPKLLLLDEPASGLTDTELDQLLDLIRHVRERGAAVLVTDHNVAFMSELCDVISVVNVGRNVAKGTPEEIRVHPDVVEAYLGTPTVTASGTRPPRAATTSSPLLEVVGLTCGYEGAPVLRNVDLAVPQGEVTAVVGPNGAGKTTLMRIISGMMRPAAGHVAYKNKNITSVDSRRRLRLGISHVPQGRGMFNGLTVQESLELGAYSIGDIGGRRRRMNEMLELFPVLGARRSQLSGSLSGGEQQMLAIARALMSDPQLLLLDEPTLGLAPVIIQRVIEMVGELHKREITVLIVEQNTAAAFEMSTFAHVLSGGSVVLSGPTAKVAASPVLRDAFLGAAKSLA